MIFEPFVIRALIAGILVAAAAAPIGSLMVWRRMAYFGDTLSHSSLAGVILGLALGVNQSAAVAALACVLAYVMARIKDGSLLDRELVLLMIGQAALCASVVGLSAMKDVRSDLLGYLFGDILSVTSPDVIVIAALCLACVVLAALSWEKQIFIALSPDLARSHGVSVPRESLKFTFLTAFFIAAAVKTTGILLVSGLLIIPPQCARFFARTPEEMALGAAAAGVFSVVSGVGFSLVYDTPTGPTCILAASALFLLCFLCHICHKKTT